MFVYFDYIKTIDWPFGGGGGRGGVVVDTVQTNSSYFYNFIFASFYCTGIRTFIFVYEYSTYHLLKVKYGLQSL